MRELGLSQKDLARLTETHINTVNRWAAGQSRAPRVLRRYLELRLKVRKLAGELATRE